MSRGVGPQILLLAAMAMALIILGALAVIVLGVRPDEGEKGADTFGMLMWRALTHTLDPGTLGNDGLAAWGFLFAMLAVTIGGIFVVSALIGVLNQGFGRSLERLRRGRSVVVESDHTVVLGWTPKIHTVLRELAWANINHKHACVVILADRDKVDMDAEVAQTVHGTRLRVVTRTGSALAMKDLQLASLPTSKAVVVLAPEVHDDGTPMAAHESDTVVLKTLLAIAKSVPVDNVHIVAEIYDERTEGVARLVVGPKAALVLAGPLVSRLLVQTGRQSGLSAVYTELLDFEGVEVYVQPEPTLVGKTFREAIYAYDTSTVIGLRSAAGEMLVPPPFDRVVVAGDQIIVISEADDTILPDGKPPNIDVASIVANAPDHVHPPERTLVLGTSARLPLVLAELDAYVTRNSEVAVVGEGDPEQDIAAVRGNLQHIRVSARPGDLTERGLLESLDITSYDHVIVLSETRARTQEMADARTTVTLLHLRDLERRAGKKVPITSEILDIQNRDLAAVAEADDFIVSNTLVSLMVSQLAENPELVHVFDELFSSGGFELYLKPAAHYVEAGDVTFATVTEAALRRNEVAIGYRFAARAKDSQASYGVVVSPAKSAVATIGPGDKVIVLAED
ncbi:MAG TPA: hypothetical protein VGO00_20565 [Kofleriaceae bacterium]|nr:hypothetical protein [Kofleriaceae bacterium]